MRFNVSLSKRLLLLLCVFIICTLVVGGLSIFIMGKAGTTTASLRISTVIQDIMMFVAPAIITAVIITRQPAELLAVNSKINVKMLLLGIGIYIASYPAMELVIYLNSQLPLPEKIAQYFWDMENTQAQATEMIFGPRNIPNLIVSLLVVAVMAGFSEEMIFRGTLQRILSTGGVNRHAAIWISAVIFSLMHFQPYGFVPRLLLGAFFGYLLCWSGCLWVPIILHMLNNSSAIISVWAFGSDLSAESISQERLLSPMFIVLCALSVAATIWLLRIAAKEAVAEPAPPQDDLIAKI